MASYNPLAVSFGLLSAVFVWLDCGEISMTVNFQVSVLCNIMANEMYDFVLFFSPPGITGG